MKAKPPKYKSERWLNAYDLAREKNNVNDSLIIANRFIKKKPKKKSSGLFSDLL